MSYKEIRECRICGNTELVLVLSLGEQSLTGVFPRDRLRPITSGPLELVKCQESHGESSCGLVQLRHSYSVGEMYGENYGYRSGLNPLMVAHLGEKVNRLLTLIPVGGGDLIIDIGSNDSTLLQAYPKVGADLVGVDPTGRKFQKYYPSDVELIPEFFSSEAIRARYGSRKAKVVTSVAMFYDLEDPLGFMRQVYDVLDNDGVWVFEQSYMPTMLEMNAYDTICHEHLEYYRLKQIKWMMDRVGFQIVDVEFNAVNGGSFSVTAAKDASKYGENAALLKTILRREEEMGLGTLLPYERFRQDVYRHRHELPLLIREINVHGKRIIGWGASTKGNVMLQFCNLSSDDIPFIADVNRDKWGCYTPGTGIPIISETDAKAMSPDYLMILPWHFRQHFLEKEGEFVRSGGKLLFPLPVIEVYSG